MDYQEIMVLLSALITEGRLTGEIYLDGTLVYSNEDTVVEDPPEFDANGFGPRDSYGCVQLQAVQNVIDEFMNGNEFEQHVAMNTPQYYGIFVEDRHYPQDEVTTVLRDNAQRHLAVSFMTGKPFISRFIDGNGNIVPNHAAVTQTGNETSYQMMNDIGNQIARNMRAQAVRLANRVDHSGDDLPSVGPN